MVAATTGWRISRPEGLTPVLARGCLRAHDASRPAVGYVLQNSRHAVALRRGADGAWYYLDSEDPRGEAVQVTDATWAEFGTEPGSRAPHSHKGYTIAYRVDRADALQPVVAPAGAPPPAGCIVTPDGPPRMWAPPRGNGPPAPPPLPLGSGPSSLAPPPAAPPSTGSPPPPWPVPGACRSTADWGPDWRGAPYRPPAGNGAAVKRATTLEVKRAVTLAGGLGPYGLPSTRAPGAPFAAVIQRARHRAIVDGGDDDLAAACRALRGLLSEATPAEVHQAGVRYMVLRQDEAAEHALRGPEPPATANALRIAVNARLQRGPVELRVPAPHAAVPVVDRPGAGNAQGQPVARSYESYDYGDPVGDRDWELHGRRALVGPPDGIAGDPDIWRPGGEPAVLWVCADDELPSIFAVHYDDGDVETLCRSEVMRRVTRLDGVPLPAWPGSRGVAPSLGPSSLEDRIPQGLGRQRAARVLTFNCDGLGLSADEVRHLLRKTRPDVAFLVETHLIRQQHGARWLSDVWKAEGYDAYLSSTPARGRGRAKGGVATLISTGWAHPSTVKPAEGPGLIPGYLGGVTVRTTSGDDLTLLGAYVPPGSDNAELAASVRQSIALADTHYDGRVVIGGDFNGALEGGRAGGLTQADRAHVAALRASGLRYFDRGPRRPTHAARRADDGSRIDDCLVGARLPPPFPGEGCRAP